MGWVKRDSTVSPLFERLGNLKMLIVQSCAYSVYNSISLSISAMDRPCQTSKAITDGFSRYFPMQSFLMSNFWMSLTGLEYTFEPNISLNCQRCGFG